MTKFTVYQIDLNKFLDDGQFISHEMTRKHFKLTFDGEVSSMDFLLYYRPVCEIEANNLDEVFEIGNIGPESRINRLDRMHSISVGDVICDEETGKLHSVAKFGFSRVGENDEKEVA